MQITRTSVQHQNIAVILYVNSKKSSDIGQWPHMFHLLTQLLQIIKLILGSKVLQIYIFGILVSPFLPPFIPTDIQN